MRRRIRTLVCVMYDHKVTPGSPEVLCVRACERAARK
jgi:hypothetical protein